MSSPPVNFLYPFLFFFHFDILKQQNLCLISGDLISLTSSCCCSLNYFFFGGDSMGSTSWNQLDLPVWSWQRLNLGMILNALFCHLLSHLESWSTKFQPLNWISATQSEFQQNFCGARTSKPISFNNCFNLCFQSSPGFKPAKMKSKKVEVCLFFQVFVYINNVTPELWCDETVSTTKTLKCCFFSPFFLYPSTWATDLMFVH